MILLNRMAKVDSSGCNDVSIRPLSFRNKHIGCEGYLGNGSFRDTGLGDHCFLACAMMQYNPNVCLLGKRSATGEPCKTAQSPFDVLIGPMSQSSPCAMDLVTNVAMAPQLA